MKEHPIIFNTDMVRAILEGRKTMTRRIVTKANSHMDCFRQDWGLLDFNDASIEQPPSIHGYDGTFLKVPMPEHETRHRIYPKYEKGDRLWIRETFQSIVEGGFTQYIYRASENGKLWEENSEDWIWRPPIFMPRLASRITLEITDVRVERLQDITPHDASAEGLPDLESSIIGSFARLWNIINGKRGSWKDNPFVWVITFKKIT